ncbi:MAG: hypothetical protein JO016_00365 [Actinobacteria bacterium]|nr:hypothetical protein [Actinomycetota bacterium]
MTALAGAAGAERLSPGPPPRRLARLGWVTWRQHRATLIGVGLFTALVAGYMLISGLRLHQLGNAAVQNGCVQPSHLTAPCRPILSPFSNGWAISYASVLNLLLPVPAIAIGVFLGAPLLAREYGSGTTRFAWTQATTRTRQTVAKLALLGLAVLAVGAVLGWLGQWSMQPVSALTADQYDRWEPFLFVATPVTAAAGAGLAFAAGVLAGVVTRRVVPAMAVTVVVTAGFAYLTYNQLHYWLLSLGQRQSADPALGGGASVGYAGATNDLHRLFFFGVGGRAGAWVDQGWYAGPDRRPLSWAQLERIWGHPKLLAQLHDTFQVTWQPVGRYWLFQSAQGGTEVLLALLLGALAVWLVRRRMA